MNVKRNWVIVIIIIIIMWLCLSAGFGLMTGFIELFDTARDYTLQLTITHTQHTSVHSHFFTAVAW
jgi:hypothetical protein